MSDQETTATTETTEEIAQTEEAFGEEEFEFVEDPSFTVDYKGDCAYEVKTTIPAANEAKQTVELFDELEAEAELPGFRKGKAPRKLLEKKFSKAVRADATEKLVGAAFKKLIKDEDLHPIDLPDIDGLEDNMERADDAPMELTFSFEVAPRCQLGDYKGIAVERPVLKIADEDVQKALDDMRGRYALYETLESGAAEEGDQVIIDFKGTIDGEEFAGGAAENYPYILGSKRFFPEFEAALQGAESGAELSCEVPFPEDYPSKEVAGRTATFAIKVAEIKRKKLPELNDEFAEQAGAGNLAALRADIEKQLQEGASAQSDRIAENNAIKTIVEASTFELPKSLVQSSANEYYNQEIRRLMSLRVPQSEIEERDEEIKKEAEENALRNIKGYVAVSEIGKAEDIEVTDADFEKEAEAIQGRTGMDMEVIGRFLAQEEQRDEYFNRIFRTKALAVVMENAKVTEKEVTQEELEQDDEEA